MAVVLTGAAGFIGSQVAKALLDRGERVVGVDNLNTYYDVTLKQARLARLEQSAAFTFHRMDVADRDAMMALFATLDDSEIHIVNLAAQAGVRYSVENPYAYVNANIVGHVVMMEAACTLGARLKGVAYASSSSVYGSNDKLPFNVEDKVDKPVSVYAATKRSAELLSYSYSHLYGIPTSGLRFFTVYGPWGRPDMAYYIFTRNIMADQPITVYNNGKMQRDFTYIDDVVAGVIAAMDHPPAPDASGVPYALYNLGNHKSEELLDFIHILEDAIGKKAEIDFQPLQSCDALATFADIEKSQVDLGYNPSVSIAEGLPRFVEWYKDYHHV